VKPSGDAVIVGLEQRTRQRDRPRAFEDMLGHEVSHLELAETRLAIWARRAVLLHFRTLGWAAATFCLALGFVDRRGIGSHPSFGGFVPVFDGTVYTGLSSQFVVLILSSAIVFIYSYYFVVRREHMHDFRGSQLAETDALADVFAAQRSSAFRPFDAFTDFFNLHPNPTARTRVIRSRDLILLSAILYPLVMSGLQPLTLLLTAGWRDFFGVSREGLEFRSNCRFRTLPVRRSASRPCKVGTGLAFGCKAIRPARSHLRSGRGSGHASSSHHPGDTLRLAPRVLS
jgi:hypothetical protein